MRRILLLCALTAAGCGSSSSSPAGPTIAQVGGIWIGSVSQTTASGGPECLLLFQTLTGSTDQYTIQINQNGSTLTASQNSAASSQICSYTGTAAASSITLNASTCDPVLVSTVCNNNARDVYLDSRAINANINSGLMTGTVNDTYKVYASGDTTTVLGVITTGHSLVAQKQPGSQ